METKNKIIYSLKKMTQLVELGFMPIQTLPNPKDPRYNCWVFECGDAFDIAVARVLGGEQSG